MQRTKMKHLKAEQIGKPVHVCGWIRSVRDQKTFAFIELNDGSTLSNLQIISEDPATFQKLSTGTSVSIKGTLVESPGKNQKWEVKSDEIIIYGGSPAEDYPLQKKRHSFEFLRTIGHLRPRTNTQGAVARVRSHLTNATHRFFQERDFVFVNTPIITSLDAEGAGEQFLVTTIDLEKPPKHSGGGIDYSKDFFGRPAHLAVSGQLNGEAMACALGDIYTFGPTFRAENSHTARHLAEFWMIEPEMAFCDLKQDMDVAESYVKACIQHIFDHCEEDMAFFDQFMEKGLIERLQVVLNSNFDRLSYTEAIDILLKAKQTFDYPVEWGMDLQTEHERYLSEQHCKKPVFIYNYPEKIKAFYMRNNDDGKTVAAFDLLVPKIGELIGGSQREDREDLLEKKIIDFGLSPDDFWWYLQLRKYGSVPHAGFGLGFERLIMFATGVENIRDVIPFPRYPGHSEF